MNPASTLPEPHPVLTVAAVREVEARHPAAAAPSLMERAGDAAAKLATELATGRDGRVLVLCGPGNNGGDGFVLARLLRAAGREVTTVFDVDPTRLPVDAAAAYAAFVAAGGGCESAPPDDHFGIALVVDALFGIGIARPVAGEPAHWIDRVNAWPCPRLAVDIPSGLDADTGARHGVTFRATHCATFIALKPGLLTLDGPDHCGRLSVHDLGLGLAPLPPGSGTTLAPALFRERLVARPRASHKGHMGDAGIIGGATGMVGAALLAGRAALRLGAGRVFVGLLAEGAPTVDAAQPELMLREPADVLARSTALALGPGLGTGEAARRLLAAAIDHAGPLLLDADALNLVAARPVLARALRRRARPAVLTPHPAEAARLLACDTAEVQRDRRTAALALARQLACHVVLKGCGSIVAHPDGRWRVNTSGNPGMAAAGMGDVLTGMALALLAQGWPEADALAAAVHLHGLAADALVGSGVGPIGLTAGELIDAGRAVMNGWIAAASP